MDEIERHFRAGVERFNRGEFFAAHEEMEDAMNLLEDDTRDWDFFRGILRAAVANHKLAQGETPSAIIHLRAALGLLAPYPDRHRGIRLRELRSALSAQLARLESAAPECRAPRIDRLENDFEAGA
jgi:predicted metal-dependent hydrolase